MAVLESIGIIALSIGIGFLYFYLLSPLKGKTKRKQINDAISLLINFIIYIWIGKIIANITVFISDPIAVLAFPSNAQAIYIATGLLIINIIYKQKRENMNISQSLFLYFPTFLAATFMYEMIQLIVNGQKYNVLTLLLIAVFLVVFTLQKKFTTRSLIIMILINFVGLFLISLLSSLTTLFGYILAPSYFLILCLLLILFVYFEKRAV